MLKEDVIAHFGGVAATARALKITKGAVSNWYDNQHIPRGSAYQVQVITAGKLQVNPADYPQKRKPEQDEAAA